MWDLLVVLTQSQCWGKGSWGMASQCQKRSHGKKGHQKGWCINLAFFIRSLSLYLSVSTSTSPLTLPAFLSTIPFNSHSTPGNTGNDFTISDYGAFLNSFTPSYSHHSKGQNPEHSLWEINPNTCKPKQGSMGQRNPAANPRHPHLWYPFRELSVHCLGDYRVLSGGVGGGFVPSFFNI